MLQHTFAMNTNYGVGSEELSEIDCSLSFIATLFSNWSLLVTYEFRIYLAQLVKVII